MIPHKQIGRFVVLPNFLTGGPIGSSASIDNLRQISVAQTTASQTITIPSPTDTTVGYSFQIVNTGSVSFTVLSQTVNPASFLQVSWTGSVWCVATAAASVAPTTGLIYDASVTGPAFTGPTIGHVSIVNTATGGSTVAYALSPTQGQQFGIQNYVAANALNNVIITGFLSGGRVVSYAVIPNSTVIFTYVDAVYGWTIDELYSGAPVDDQWVTYANLTGNGAISSSIESVKGIRFNQTTPNRQVNPALPAAIGLYRQLKIYNAGTVTLNVSGLLLYAGQFSILEWIPGVFTWQPIAAQSTPINIPNSPDSTTPPLQLSDFSASNFIGTAAATVDVNSHFIFFQSTPDIQVFLPAPTSVGSRLVTLENQGNVPFTLLNPISLAATVVSPGKIILAQWNGGGWIHLSSSSGLTYDASVPALSFVGPVIGHVSLVDTTTDSISVVYGLVASSGQQFTIVNESSSSLPNTVSVTGVRIANKIVDLVVPWGTTAEATWIDSVYGYSVRYTNSSYASDFQPVLISNQTANFSVSVDASDLFISTQSTPGIAFTLGTPSVSAPRPLKFANTGIATITVNGIPLQTGTFVIFEWIPEGWVVQANTTVNVPNSPSSATAPKAIANLASGGTIGTAATTVDRFSAFLISQTTAGQILTVPVPSSPLGARLITISSSSASTVSFSLLGITFAPGQTQAFAWTGAAWGSLGYNPSLTVTRSSVNVTVAASPRDTLVYLVDASAGARTVTLPSSSTSLSMTVRVKKTDVSANTVTILAQASDLIDGASSFVIATTNNSNDFVADQLTSWAVV